MQAQYNVQTNPEPLLSVQGRTNPERILLIRSATIQLWFLLIRLVMVHILNQKCLQGAAIESHIRECSSFT